MTVEPCDARVAKSGHVGTLNRTRVRSVLETLFMGLWIENGSRDRVPYLRNRVLLLTHFQKLNPEFAFLACLLHPLSFRLSLAHHLRRL